MKYEPYSIREGFILFREHLEECQKLLREMTNLPELLTLQKNILFLSDMCKKQSLYLIEKVNVNVGLSSCSNSILNIKSEFLDDPDKKIIEREVQNIDSVLSNVIQSVSIKCNTITEHMTEEKSVKETVEKLEDYRASAELIQTYKDSVKDIAAKSGDELLYSAINKRIERETNLVRKTLEAGLTFVKGSVAINSYIRSFDLKGLDHSVLKIPGISFNHARKEVITPIYVFHNQKLAVIDVNKKRITIKGKRRIDPEKIFAERLEMIERSTNLINQTKKNPTPYLVSPLFKNVRFLWFSENIDAFKNTKEGTVKLLW